MSSTSAKPVTVLRFWHSHPLKIYKRGVIFSNCLKCGEPLNRSCYFCNSCNRGWHVDCIPGSQDIDHPCHPNHPLELVQGEEPHDTTTAQWKCSLCEKPFNEYMYHCQICDFSMDQSCVTNPPPYTIHSPNCHKEHAVTLLTRRDSFVCQACGTQGEGKSYVCHLCSLRFHTDCIHLPYVININCHDHPVFHAYFIVGEGYNCGVCLKEVNWRHGAYFCDKCPSFVVHSLCATSPGMWDGLELPGLPKGVETLPYKVIGDGVINHFSHEEHNLRYVSYFSMRSCDACVRPIHSDRQYKCMDCGYSLHVACANLSRQVWNELSRRPFTLLTSKVNESNYFFCDACERVSNGFRYEGDGITFDTYCASALRRRSFISHQHPLYPATLEPHTCGDCNNVGDLVLRCDTCNFSLDFKCATLPEMIRHKCDDKHFLLLRRGEVASGTHWCEICETTLDPNIRFYTCPACGIVCHVECVLGDFVNLRPGLLNVNDKGRKLEVVPNVLNTRHLCGSCGSRCRLPLAFKFTHDNVDVYRCSFRCFTLDEIKDLTDKIFRLSRFY